jgi:hypothetical protein
MYAPRARPHPASHLGLLATFFNTLQAVGFGARAEKKAIGKQVPTRAFRLRLLADGATEPLLRSRWCFEPTAARMPRPKDANSSCLRVVEDREPNVLV